MKPKTTFKLTFSACAITLIIIMLINTKTISNSILNGIHLCLNVLIPSMFMFLILCDLFQQTNILNFALKPIEPIFKRLFKIDKKLTSTVFFSLICGYPTGAYLISNLLEQKQISKNTAERLICFCVNAGPAFLIGAISIPLTGNVILGFFLFISQIGAFLLVGTLCSIKTHTENIDIRIQNPKKLPEIFVNSVNKSIKTMAMICGFAIMFSALIELIFKFTPNNIQNNQIFKILIAGFLEITNGINQLNNIQNLNIFLLIALLTSFGGVCVHFQLKAILAKFKISFKKFYLWRIVYCLTSVAICTFLFKALNTSVSTCALIKFEPVMSTKDISSSIGIIILSIALLCCDKKNIIIKKI